MTQCTTNVMALQILMLTSWTLHQDNCDKFADTEGYILDNLPVAEDIAQDPVLQRLKLLPYQACCVQIQLL